jgi:hypothetical protein
MAFTINIDIPKPDKLIAHQHKILSIGSCFTEHIGNALRDLKFEVLQNPHGILFDPMAVCNSLVSYIQGKRYKQEDLFYLNELWHSWDHHSRFSHTEPQETLALINASQEKAFSFLKEADWLIVTLGSAFSYRLTTEAEHYKEQLHNFPLGIGGVANCHRAPAKWFTKHLSTIDNIIAGLDNTIHQLFRFNPKLHIIFTISPVRHIRDGVIENNRSKARLLEAVHHLVNKFDRLYYFPSYELVIDVLRDYRFYDIDLVHPNYPATEYVLEQFLKTHTPADLQPLLQEVKRLHIARKHRSSHPATNAHRQFLQANLVKAKALEAQYPYLDLQEEIQYFSQG